MAALLVLEDGRLFHGSSMGVDGVLTLASREIDDEHSKLRRWLEDKGSRCAPFQDFDLRGLSEKHRVVFWEACEKALKRLEDKYGAISELPGNHRAAHTLVRLVQEHRSVEAGEPIPEDSKPARTFDGSMEDLDDIWSRDAT